ncbi:hypothetical protein L195_g061912, partial [Trifolium pratense]
RRDVDGLVESLVEGLRNDDCDGHHDQGDVELADKKEVSQVDEEAVEKEVERVADTVNAEGNGVESSLKHSSFPKPGTLFGREEHNTLHRKRSESCPPKVSRSIISGPWSLEWL